MARVCIKTHRSLTRILLFVGATILLSAAGDHQVRSEDELWRRINSMSLREKVGQMTQINLPLLLQRQEDGSVKHPVSFDATALSLALDSFKVGSVMNTADHALSLETWQYITSFLHEQSEERVGIPILYGIDAIHGANYTSGSTLLPHQLMIAASFNDSLAALAAGISAYETKASGIPWVFSPILDVVRNPYWVQFFETFGEDTYLAKQMGKAMVRGYQAVNSPSAQVLACAKHFVAVGDVRTGKDRTPIDIGERKLRDVFLPPFEGAVSEGVASIMIGTNEIDGIPTHANSYLLKGVLRDELGFEGVLISDWGDVQNLYRLHRSVASMEEAVKLAINSGIDMVMVPNDFEFSKTLYELVLNDELDQARIDASVYRILKAKQAIGLLDGSFLPGEGDFPRFGGEEHYKSSYEIALEGACLLKNEGEVLPLSADSKILICGNASDDLSIQNGAWSRTWQGRDTFIHKEPYATIYQAFSERAKNVSFADRRSSAAWLEGVNTNMVDEAEVILVCLGERPATEKPGDVPSIDLPASDQALIEFLHRRGKTIVLVMMQSRPRIVRTIEPLVDAILMGFVPGNSGGEAIADLLLGKASPSGKLPFSYPRYEGLYMPYAHKHIEAMDTNYGMSAYQPQWAFGSGIGYVEIAYDEISLASDTLQPDDTLAIDVRISNLGDQGQKESVLVFIADRVSKVTPEVKKLAAYKKVNTLPNRSRTVQFSIPISELKSTGLDPRSKTLEPGWFDIFIANRSASFYLAAGS